MEDNFISQSSKRLKDERERLGLSQVESGTLCNVSREMWGKYERGISVPGGDVLFSFAAAGADVQYIITGIRSNNMAALTASYSILRPDQIALLDNVEHCSKEDQDAIKRMAFIAARAAEWDEKKSGTDKN